jgi:Protein of unknown function (DUF2889)
MNRPDGLGGDLVLTGHARDLVTAAPDKVPTVADRASLHGRVAFHDGRAILELQSAPEESGLSSLVGLPAASGFRGEAQRLLPELAESRSPLYLLIDDVPVGVLVSGFAMRRDDAGQPLARTYGNVPKPDLCAGWQTGGTMMLGIDATGHTPVPQGALAPGEPADDPYAWHSAPTLGARGVRRRRRLDLAVRDVLELDAVFRDSYLSPAGMETVIHEYGLSGTIEPGTLRILSLDATAHVLPWPECPQAAGSAGHLVGRTVHDLRRRVRADFIGTSTCTHLNDMLRSVEDVAYLARLLSDAGSAVRA